MTAGADSRPIVEVATLCKQGGRERNEDACGYWFSEVAGCYVVSDGAGGHGGGDVASKAAVSQVIADFTLAPQVSANGMADYIQRANLVVLEQQKTSDAYHDMRATLVVLCLDFEQGLAVWGHAGDSRLYCFRDQRVMVRTLDHSVVQMLVAAGRADEQALREHPQRSTLLLALGSQTELEASVLGEPFACRDGDAFLLCSDGLWEHLEDAVMLQLLARATSAQDWIDALERELGQRVPPRHDNYTGLALWVGRPRSGDDDPTRVPLASAGSPRG